MQNPSTPDVLPTVVLGCAKNDRLLLPPMLEGLVAAGFEVEVASGLEVRGDPLLAASLRLRDAAAFVLLSSAELPAHATDHLRARLMTTGVPAQHILVIKTDEANGAIDVAERLAAVRIVASHVRRPTSVRLGSVRGISEGSGTRPATFIGVPPAPPPTSASAFPPSPPPLPGTRMPIHAPVSGSVPVLDVELDDAPPPRRRRVLAIAGASAGALALIVFFAARGSTPEPSAQETAAVKESWMALYERAREGIGPQAPADVARVESPIAIAGPVLVPVPVPSVAPQPIPVAPVAVAPVAVAPVPEEPKLAVAPPPPPDTAGIEVADEEGAAHVDEVEIQAIYAGLVGQKFRALDIVLVSPEPRKRKGKKVYKTAAKLGWAAAEKYCESLEISGVGDWRLPRVGELGSLSAGELLPDGKFWSQTEGDTFGRTRVVWNTKSAKMGMAPVRWKGGRVVCVRTLAKAPELPTK